MASSTPPMSCPGQGDHGVVIQNESARATVNDINLPAQNGSEEEDDRKTIPTPMIFDDSQPPQGIS